MIGNTAAQNNFGALRHGAIEVDVLAGVGVGVVQVLDLVAELVVEVHRAERHAIVEQRLQQAGFDGPVLLRLQVGIRQRGERSGDAKGLLEAGLLDSLRVAKVQAGAAEDGVSAQRQECHGSARADFAAKTAVVDVANARQDRQPPPHDGLLRKQIVVKAQAVGGGGSKVRI